MLTELYVQNLAIIEDLAIKFEPGLNILTGETGAGKTILITALQLLRGGKATSELVRTGTKSAKITAVFDLENKTVNSEFSDLLEQTEWDPQDTLVIKRTVPASGKSRAYINGAPVVLQTLRQLIPYLLDVVSQHEPQKLLNQESHLYLLDEWGGLDYLRNEFARIYADYQQVRNEILSLEQKRDQAKEQYEWLHHQLTELKQANLRLDEEEELKGLKQRSKYKTQLYESCFKAVQLLQEGELSAAEKLQESIRYLNQAAELDATLAASQQSLEEVIAVVSDTGRDLEAYLNQIDNSDFDAEAVETRLDVIYQLKRKHQTDVAGLLEKINKFEGEISLVDNFDDLLAEKQERAGLLQANLQNVAKTLSKQRRQAASKLSELVEDQLSDLSMPKTHFFVRCNPLDEKEWSPLGGDRIDFLIAPNVGEPLKPLQQIASGGELSRILLAVKEALLSSCLLAETIVFDEVDTGIGGAVAESVGRKMKELAQGRQIFCVTHLPQVASFAQHHVRIYKEVRKGRTVTQLDTLTADERVAEIARMLGGEQTTKASLVHAAEMLKNSQ